MARTNPGDVVRTGGSMRPQERGPGQPAHPEGTGGVISTVKETTQNLAGAAGNLAGQAKDKAQEWTAAAAETMSQARDTTGEWAATAARRTGETAQEVGQQLTELIRRYPVPALLASFALGFLLARATRS